MPSALTKSAYQSLLGNITRIYRRANGEAKTAMDQILVRTYWEIGEYIVKVEQKNNLRAQYGAQLLENLSKDLTGQHGQGFSLRNLNYMRQFYVAHPILQPAAKLNWTKQCILLSIKDNKIRKDYEAKAIQRDWTRDQLIAALKKDGVKRGKGGLKQAVLAVTEQSRRPAPFVLNYVRGRIGVHRVIESQDARIKKVEKLLDLGFNVHRAGIAGVASRRHGDLVRVSGKERVRLDAAAEKKDLYTYPAIVENVVDDDTLWVNVEIGFGVFTRKKLRLRGIDAPEIDAKRGQTAKGFVERTLDAVDFIVIKTYGTDKYDRYLTDVFYLVGESDPVVVARDGVYLNQEILDRGLASPYGGHE